MNNMSDVELFKRLLVAVRGNLTKEENDIFDEFVSRFNGYKNKGRVIKYLKVTKYLSLMFCWNRELTPIQQRKGWIYVHKFANARDLHLYIGHICIGWEEERGSDFRPTRLSEAQRRKH